VDAAEADVGVARGDPQEGDLAEVERDHAVLRVEVVPAALLELLAQVLEVIVGQAGGDHLAAFEADLDTLWLCHQCPFAGSTISVSTPPVERGWRKATRLSRMPTRGSASIRSMPAAARRGRSASMSSTPPATWGGTRPFF